MLCIKSIDINIEYIQESLCNWDGSVSEAANTILHQHAIQGDLNDLQVILFAAMFRLSSTQNLIIFLKIFRGVFFLF